MTSIIISVLQREGPSTQSLLAVTLSGLPQESNVTLSHQHGPKVSNACIKRRKKFLENISGLQNLRAK
jgi:hypothetical protein